jgi:hypothetical protein
MINMSTYTYLLFIISTDGKNVTGDMQPFQYQIILEEQRGSVQDETRTPQEKKFTGNMSFTELKGTSRGDTGPK